MAETNEEMEALLQEISRNLKAFTESGRDQFHDEFMSLLKTSALCSQSLSALLSFAGTDQPDHVVIKSTIEAAYAIKALNVRTEQLIRKASEAVGDCGLYTVYAIQPQDARQIWIEAADRVGGLVQDFARMATSVTHENVYDQCNDWLRVEFPERASAAVSLLGRKTIMQQMEEETAMKIVLVRTLGGTKEDES